MRDDRCCLFIVLASMLTLAMPAPGQPVFAVFAFALIVAAYLAAERDTPETGAHRRGRDTAGR